MALSTVTYVGNGVTNQFSLNFALGILDRADVSCRVGVEVDGSGQPAYRTITWINDNLVQIDPAPSAGARIVFKRSVDKDVLLVNYEDGAVLNEENLNESQKQAIMIAHEAIDQTTAAAEGTEYIEQAVVLTAGHAANAQIARLGAESAAALALTRATNAGTFAANALTQANRATTQADRAQSILDDIDAGGGAVDWANVGNKPLGTPNGVATLDVNGKVPSAQLPSSVVNAAEVVKVPRNYVKTDPITLTKLFESPTVTAGTQGQKVTESLLPFNNVTNRQMVSDAQHVLAEGSVNNGPGAASIGKSISLWKENYNTPQVKAGEIDALYIVLRQDGPRANDPGTFSPNRSDGCGILIDAAFYDKTGFVGGIEGVTTQFVDPATPGSVRRAISYQLACINAATGTDRVDSHGHYIGAITGPNSTGILINNFEGSGGYFDKFISCGTDTGQVFEVDRRGTVSIGKHVVGGNTLNAFMHLGLNTDASLSFINSNKSVAVANLTQAGDFSIFGNYGGKNLSLTGDAGVSGVMSAYRVRTSILNLAPGTAATIGSEFVAGTLSVGASGRLRYCDANGAQPKFVVLSTT